MRMINTNNPVFIVGAPKTGSTSLHIELSNSEKFNYTALKDTQLLAREDFSIEHYAKYFQNNDKPIMEVDQNLAISKTAFININKYFNNPTIIYVIRDSKDRFISAYRWLKKVGLVKNIEESIEKYYPWMINQGLYKENIEKNIIPYCKSGIIIIKFEDLVNNDGVTFSKLLDILKISSDQDNIRSMLMHNKSTEPRSKYLIKILKKMYQYTKYLLPLSINRMLKTSSFVDKILFNDRTDKSTLNELDLYEEYAEHFSKTDKFINNLDFYEGICDMRLNK